MWCSGRLFWFQQCGDLSVVQVNQPDPSMVKFPIDTLSNAFIHLWPLTVSIISLEIAKCCLSNPIFPSTFIGWNAQSWVSNSLFLPYVFTGSLLQITFPHQLEVFGYPKIQFIQERQEKTEIFINIVHWHILSVGMLFGIYRTLNKYFLIEWESIYWNTMCLWKEWRKCTSICIDIILINNVECKKWEIEK